MHFFSLFCSGALFDNIWVFEQHMNDFNDDIAITDSDSESHNAYFYLKEKTKETLH